MRRRQFITLLSGAAAWPVAVRAQQTAMPVIGFLNGGTTATYAPYVMAFRDGLASAGYLEGRDVAIDYHWMEGQYDGAAALATELVRRQVALICVTASTALVQAAKAATSTIPIVFAIGADPVKFGLVASLNRPGGNVTGVSFLANLLSAKQLEVLHEAVPNATAVAFLVNPRNPNAATDTAEVQVAANRLGLKLTVVSAETGDAIDKAFATLVREQAGAILIAADPLFAAHRERIALLAERHTLPTIFNTRDFAKVGGLMSYGPNQTDAYRQTGAYAGRILRGEKPADLPIVQPTRFELVINLNTVKTIGLNMPPTLLARADEVIE
jgi:putative ABC transport system substrate-binding protein